jgi:hypothetical protein
VVALRAVVAEMAHGIKTEQDLERAARLAEALGNGFDEANGTHSVSDKEAALRLAEGALGAVIQLAGRCEDAEVNLPFLATSDKGPVHLSHKVTRATLAGLDALGVYVVKEAPPLPAAPVATAPAPVVNRRRWWPFG